MRAGPPAETILAAAAEVGADLVALSSHGYSGMERLFFGSTAEQVLRTSRVPILVVKRGDDAKRAA